jgi:serine/threonine-protein kinase
MPLAPGVRVGPYEVTSAIGAGGMGEVYRARDTKLNRDVALKSLPDAFASDPERLARFKREAQVLASLNHSNIAQIYGFEDASGTHALVMELVEGPTLADRIARGPIPINDALAIARQIADALGAAHEQGIIHRDLKPANVKVRADGAVKVLDFGLAKAIEPAHGSGLSHQAHGSGLKAQANFSNSPTITSPAMTQLGVILGTAAYMSPEQARGRPVDKRADIWAFGCVLFEMLAGRRAFDGSDVSDMLAAVLRSEPDWSALPADTPPAVRTVLRRCLEKDPKRRIGDSADVLLLMEELTELSRAQAASSPGSTARRATRWLVPVAAAIAGALVAGAVLWQMRPVPAPPAVQRLVVALPDGDTFSGIGRTFVAISPDASRLVYVANQQMYLRRLDQLTPTPISRTGGASSPFFSPDGEQIGFWQDGQLKKVAVAGGTPQVICAARNPFGVSWAADGTILFGQGADGISRVSADGGEPTVVVPADEKRREIFYGPELLPDGKTLLFTVDSRLQTPGILPWDDADIVTQDLGSGQRTVIVQGGTHGRFVSTGHVLFAREETLWAVRFDPRAGGRSGSPVSVVEGIRQAGTTGGIAVGGQTGSAQFAVSSNGMLVYVEREQGVQLRVLVWVDRQGKETAIRLPARHYAYPNIAPDGRRVAIDIRDEGQDVWVLELDSLALQKLTFDPAPDIAPSWTLDGRRIATYRSGQGLFVQPADGTGSPERLIESPNSPLAPKSFVAGPDRLVLDENTSYGWSVKLFDFQSRKASDLVALPNLNAMNAVVSPDGRWLAYQGSDRSGGGRVGVYVRPFPDVEAGMWQIPCESCTRPAWARNGRELFFMGGAAQTTGITSIWAVPVESSPTFRAGTPQKLFEGLYFAQLLGRTYDVAPDGQRFLMSKSTSAGAPIRPRIVVIDNWTEELKRLAP